MINSFFSFKKVDSSQESIVPNKITSFFLNLQLFFAIFLQETTALSFTALFDSGCLIWEGWMG